MGGWIAYVRDRIRSRVAIARLLPLAGTPLARPRRRLQPRRRPRAGRVRDRDERRRRAAARRGEGGWDSRRRARARSGRSPPPGSCSRSSRASRRVLGVLGERISRRVDGIVRDRLAAASVGSPAIAALEDQELLGHLSEAGGEHRVQPVHARPGRLRARRADQPLRARVAAAAILIGVVFSWLAALAILVGSMLIRYGTRRGLVVENGMWRANMSNLRESWYFRGLALEPPAGKELRIYGLVPWAQGRHRDAYERSWGTHWPLRRRLYTTLMGRTPRSARVFAAGALVALGDAAANGRRLAARHRVRAPGRRDHRARRAFFMEADLGTEFGMSAYQALGAFEEKAATRYAAERLRQPQRRRAAARVDPLRGRLVRVPGLGARGARRARPRDPGRRLARDRRAERRRQDDADQAARAAVRADGRPDHRRRHRRARARPRELAQPDRGDLPGLRALRAAGGRQHRARRRSRTSATSRRSCRAAQRAGRARGDRRAARRPRDAAVGALRGRRRRLGRAVAAHRALARAVRARAGHVGARARRADREPRRARRGGAVRPLHRDHGRRDDDPHLAPLLDRAARRPDRRARRRRDRRAGHARRARRARRPLRGALPAAGRALRRSGRRRRRTSREALARRSSATCVGVSLRIDRRRTYVLLGLVLATALVGAAVRARDEGVRERRGRRQRDAGDGARRARRRARGSRASRSATSCGPSRSSSAT